MKTSELIQKLIQTIIRNGDMEIEVRNSAGDFDSPLDVRMQPQGVCRSYVVVIDTDDGDPTT